MSLTRKIAHNTIVQIVGKVIGTILGLFTIGMITRYLGQEGFGYYTTIMGFIQFFGILVDFGLTITTAQMLGKGKWNEEILFGNVLSLRIVSAVIFLGSAPLVALLFPYPGFVKWGIALMGLSFFFITITQVFLGFFQKHLRMVYVSLAEVGNRIFLLAAVIIAILADWGIYGVLSAVLLSNFVQVLMLYFPARKFSPIKIHFNFEVWKDIWKQTWPIALSIALNLIYLRTDIIFLSVLTTPEEIGLYGAAYKVIDVLATVPFMLAGVMLPLLARFWQEGDVPRFKKLVQQGFDALTMLAFPVVVGSFFVGHNVMALIAGEEFRSAGTILQILIVAIAFIFLNSVFAHGIVALEKQKQTIWAYGLTAIIGFTGYFFLIPRYGALGAAWVTVVTEGLIAIIIYVLYRRYSGLPSSIAKWPATLVSSLGMGAALWATQGIHVLLQIVLATLVYAFLLVITRGVSKEFIRDIITLRRYNT